MDKSLYDTYIATKERLIRANAKKEADIQSLQDNYAVKDVQEAKGLLEQFKKELAKLKAEIDLLEAELIEELSKFESV